MSRTGEGIARLRGVPARIRRRVPVRAASPSHHCACRAPFTSMYLDPRGFVRACCMNDFQLLGNVSERRLVDIWHGEQAQELRRAMERDDLSIGCEFCDWQVSEGRPDLAFSKWFADYPVSGPEPAWPIQLELSISQTCNLQCVMCNAEWSSSIRTQRDGLPPLPKVYDDAFFDDLVEFIPHLQRVKFLGGEPFLATETLRVMDLLVAHNAAARSHVTTNGTQWTPRVERILDMMPVDVAVSLDAATAETYEAIRVGSTWDGVQRNLDRFQERAARNGTDVTVTYCLMANNWHEFEQFCLQADRRGIGCAVNTVTEPAHLSLYRLTPDDLTTVVETMRAVDPSQFGRSRRTWEGEVDRLGAHLEDALSGRSVVGLDNRKLNPEFPRPFDAASEQMVVADPAAVRRRIEGLMGAEIGDRPAARIEVDRASVVTTVTRDAGLDPVVAGAVTDDLVGCDVAELPGRLAAHLGDFADVDLLQDLDVELGSNDQTFVHPDWNLKVMASTFAGGSAFVVVSVPRFDDRGTIVGTGLHLRLQD